MVLIRLSTRASSVSSFERRDKAFRFARFTSVTYSATRPSPTPAAAVRWWRAARNRAGPLRDEIVAAGTPEVLPALHPNLAQVYRQKVERVEEALRAPVVSAAAVEALRSLIDAIVVYPGERRGEMRVEMHGDLAAFLHLRDESPGASASPTPSAETAAPGMGNGGSGRMTGSLVAGARNHLCRTRFRPEARR
jgi:hypothetical protein